ncbi:MAG: hypothetical protein U0939_11715 [Pirellulales bacterium]
MSEFQIVKFRAVDRPLNDKQLELMGKQSSRAKFTKWEFEVEYHYSSFRGDIDEMLRNGYDLFASNSNSGVVDIRMRLPLGLPFAQSCWSQYVDGTNVIWNPDKRGQAGILVIAPSFEEVRNSSFDVDAVLDAAATLRDLLIKGDQRALYLVWLCGTSDAYLDPAETLEPPVPNGLGSLAKSIDSLLDYVDVDPLIVHAAADGIPDFEADKLQSEAVDLWLKSLGDASRTALLRRLLDEDPITLKAELLATMRESQRLPDWPVSPPKRLLSELLERTAELRKTEVARRRREAANRAKREAEKAELQRQQRLAEMRSAPEVWLAKAAALAEAKGVDNFREAAEILAAVRDAIGGPAGRRLVRSKALKLVSMYPTQHRLKSELRKQELID